MTEATGAAPPVRRSRGLSAAALVLLVLGIGLSCGGAWYAWKSAVEDWEDRVDEVGVRLTQIFLGTMDDAYALLSGVLAAAAARPDSSA